MLQMLFIYVSVSKSHSLPLIRPPEDDTAAAAPSAKEFHTMMVLLLLLPLMMMMKVVLVVAVTLQTINLKSKQKRLANLNLR